MCTLPPAPPPPRPPVQPSLLLKLLKSDLQSKPTLNYFTSFDYDMCKWAQHLIPLREVCTKYGICLHDVPYKYSYKHFEPILQVGPTCGLVALSMMMDGKVTASEILDIAKMEGYSNNGEMLSCLDMEKLVGKVYSSAENNIKCSTRTGDLYSLEIVEKLLNGAVLLVPYDSDFNHSPCLKKGHKAHWALVCGIVIENHTDSYISDPSNIFVLCRHGKSRHLAAWRLDKLDESNKNLLEFAPTREDDGLTYVVPEEGIGGERGLKDQYLLIEWL